MAQENAVADASAAAATAAAAAAAGATAAAKPAPAAADDAAAKAAAAAQTPEAKAAAEKAAADKAAADKAAVAAQTPEQKAAAEKVAADKAAADKAAVDKAANAKAPEKYEEFVAPKGTVLDAKVATEFKAVAKELNLSQADAQKVIDRLGPLLAADEGARTPKAVEAVLNKAREGWVAEAKADKEFGGEKIDANLATAKKAWEAFGTPALQKLLNDSGLGDHPEMIRWAFRVGSQIGPDSKLVVGAAKNAAAAGSLEERATSKLWK